MNITPISESAVVCSLPPPASLQQQRQLWAFANQLQSEQDIVEVVVGMNNLTVFTDFYVDFAPLIQRLEQYWAELKVSTFQGRHIEIPVIYGGELGQDLCEVAKLHNTTPERIVKMHSEPIYTVYMIGFQPGFPYLVVYLKACIRLAEPHHEQLFQQVPLVLVELKLAFIPFPLLVDGN